LYTEKADGKFRRSAQTAMYHILDTLTKLIAPVLTFTAEDIASNYQKDKTEPVFLQRFPEIIDVQEKVEAEIWNSLREVRDVVLKAIEGKRETGVVKHSLETKVKLHLDETNEKAKVITSFIDYLKTKSEDADRFFKDFFIVSQFALSTKKDGLNKTSLDFINVLADHADGEKCPRCWQWDTEFDEDGLCRRCQDVLK